MQIHAYTVYPKKYAHGFCFAVLCCGYKLTDFPISIRLTSLALWQSNDCPSASKATLMNMDKYFMWIHYERLPNHNKAKHNKTVCKFLGIYCISWCYYRWSTPNKNINLTLYVFNALQPRGPRWFSATLLRNKLWFRLTQCVFQSILSSRYRFSVILPNTGFGTGLL